MDKAEWKQRGLHTGIALLAGAWPAMTGMAFILSADAFLQALIKPPFSLPSFILALGWAATCLSMGASLFFALEAGCRGRTLWGYALLGAMAALWPYAVLVRQALGGGWALLLGLMLLVAWTARQAKARNKWCPWLLYPPMAYWSFLCVWNYAVFMMN